MNILIINHYAGSPILGREFRPYYLAKEWIKFGHTITIIAADFSHLRLIQPKVVSDLMCENIDGIRYIWLKTVKYKNSGYKRILNIIYFTVKLLIYYKRIRTISNPEVVIASSTYPLDIYPAYLIANKIKAKLVFELHDLWPLTPMLIGHFSKYHPFIWLMQKAENFACKKSNYYISLLANAKEYLLHHGLKGDNFFHIPNGFFQDRISVEDSTLPQDHIELINRIKSNSNIIIGYAGGHEPSNALESFIAASNHFADNKSIAFLLVGNGSQKQKLIEMVRAKNQSNVYFLPSVSKKLMLSLLGHFDILYAGGVSSILHYYGTSFNKIVEYMLAEKPIIYAVDEPNSIIEKVGCGFQISAEDEVECVKILNYLITLTGEQRTCIGKKGREYALKELNYTNLARRYLEIITSS